MIFRFTLLFSAEETATSYPSLSEFSNFGSGDASWSEGSNPSVTLPGAPDVTSSHLRGIVENSCESSNYSIDYNVDFSGHDGVNAGVLRIRLYDSTYTQYEEQVAEQGGFPGFFSDGNKTGTLNFTPAFKVEYITFIFAKPNIGTNPYTLDINSYSVTGDTCADSDQSLVINEPEGWSEAVLKLERDENFHSLIENFEGDFLFYGDNGVQNGGIDFIKNIESTYGPDADLEILIEISFDGYEYEEVFRGLLDLSTIVETEDNLLQCAIVRNDFWTKFITRQETQVDLQDPESVDGDPITVYDSVNLSMLPQLLQEKSNHTETGCYQILDSDISVNEYIQIDFDTVVFDEIKAKFNYPITSNPARPFEIFAVEFAGDYTFDVRVVLAARADYLGLGLNWAATLDGGGIAQNPIIEVYIQVNDDTPVAFNYDSVDPDVIHPYSYNGTLSLNKGDFVRIYALLTRKNTPGTGSYWIIGSALPADINTGVGSTIDDGQDTHLYVTANTIYPSTNSEGFLIHDAAAHICDRIIGQNDSVYSEFLGSPLTSGVYEEYGCGWFYAILKGLQIRLYTLIEKPFFMSFKQWWEGANPILNLGLGYETVESVTQSLLLNDSFDTSAAWTNEGIGTDWSVGAGTAEVSLFNDQSKKLTQTIENTLAGEYSMTGYYLTSGIVFGSNRIRLRIIAVDDQGTETIVKSFTPLFDVTPSSGHPDFTETFISSYPIVSIYAIVEIIQGFGHAYDVTLNYLTLTGQVGTGNEVIRIEKKEHFYQNEIAVYFSNVRPRRMYDNDYFFNNVEMGYKKWQSEDVSGIDDPQTKRIWSSRFKKLGKKISILSDWIAAGLTIEKTRRTTREKSADYKYDNDVFVIAINPVPVDISPETSPDVIDYEPELDENFTSVASLLNSDSRYNLRLTPARNFLRWLNYLSGCLQHYATSFFKFSSGEGNYDMRSTMIDTSPDCSDPADYGGAQLSEKGNIQVGADYLFIPIPIEISIPMEWEEYKMIDKKKAIGISQTDENHEAFFIKVLEYKIAQGTATGVLWPKDIFALSIVTDVPATKTCLPVEIQECAILLESSELMLTELGEVMLLESC